MAFLGAGSVSPPSNASGATLTGSPRPISASFCFLCSLKYDELLKMLHDLFKADADTMSWFVRLRDRHLKFENLNGLQTAWALLVPDKGPQMALMVNLATSVRPVANFIQGHKVEKIPPGDTVFRDRLSVDYPTAVAFDPKMGLLLAKQPLNQEGFFPPTPIHVQDVSRWSDWARHDLELIKKFRAFCLAAPGLPTYSAALEPYLREAVPLFKKVWIPAFLLNGDAGFSTDLPAYLFAHAVVNDNDEVSTWKPKERWARYAMMPFGRDRETRWEREFFVAAFFFQAATYQNTWLPNDNETFDGQASPMTLFCLTQCVALVHRRGGLPLWSLIGRGRVFNGSTSDGDLS